MLYLDLCSSAGIYLFQLFLGIFPSVIFTTLYIQMFCIILNVAEIYYRHRLYFCIYIISLSVDIFFFQPKESLNFHSIYVCLDKLWPRGNAYGLKISNLACRV